jgi:enoyl-CoA hydratase/carnithine racemase
MELPAPNVAKESLMTDQLDYTIADKVATIVLRRPEKMNAFTFR